MRKIVSVSGAAGTGKSTLLNNIDHLVDPFKVARYVLKEMKKDLYDILRDHRDTIYFQDRILELKIENDEKLKYDDSTPWIFVERCPADFFAFAKTWQPYFNNSQYNSWLVKYEQNCQESMKHYSVAILIPPGHFDHVDDGVRAKADTQELTHEYLDRFLSRSWLNLNFSSPRFCFHRMSNRTLIDRIDETERTLNEANEYFNIYTRFIN